jgi:hypothetical protein
MLVSAGHELRRPGVEGLPFTHDREVNVRRTVHQAVTGHGA